MSTNFSLLEVMNELCIAALCKSQSSVEISRVQRFSSERVQWSDLDMRMEKLEPRYAQIFQTACYERRT